MSHRSFSSYQIARQLGERLLRWSTRSALKAAAKGTEQDEAKDFLLAAEAFTYRMNLIMAHHPAHFGYAYLMLSRLQPASEIARQVKQNRSTVSRWIGAMAETCGLSRTQFYDEVRTLGGIFWSAGRRPEAAPLPPLESSKTTGLKPLENLVNAV